MSVVDRDWDRQRSRQRQELRLHQPVERQVDVDAVADALEVERALVAYDAFKALFKTSKKGNLWRMFEGRTICVFHHPTANCYKHSIADHIGVKYSKQDYDTADEAMFALWQWLELGIP